MTLLKMAYEPSVLGVAYPSIGRKRRIRLLPNTTSGRLLQVRYLVPLTKGMRP